MSAFAAALAATATPGVRVYVGAVTAVTGSTCSVDPLDDTGVVTLVPWFGLPPQVGDSVVLILSAGMLLAITAGGAPSTAHGWHDLAISDTTNFDLYSVGLHPQWRRIGPMVEVVGVITPKTAAFIDGTTDRAFATLPVGARPAQAVIQVCQGSSTNRWQLRIGPSGVIQAARYGPAASAAGAWLPFHTTYLAAD